MASSVDIVVPVWNNPFEARACISAILAYSENVRLIVVDNGSSRETELMLEEFSESMGERGLFIKSERNIGLVAAINLGLARSDGDYTVIVRPNVTVCSGWLQTLVSTAEATDAGIVSPLFSGVAAPKLPTLKHGCKGMESCTVSFATLLVRTEMRMVAGLFDDSLDGADWCLRDYVRRVTAFGYRTFITGRCSLICNTGQHFGSLQRRNEMIQNSRSAYISKWGIDRHYCVYFGAESEPEALADTVAVILNAARQGHRFTLLLHRSQHSFFRKRGWNALHTGIELLPLSMLFPLKSLQRNISVLRRESPDLLAVKGCSGVLFPSMEAAISCDELFNSFVANQNQLQMSSGAIP